MSVGQTIREEFMSQGETINAFARRLGLNYSTIRSVVTERTENPPERTVQMIAERLGTTPAYLRYHQGPKEVQAA